MAPPVFALRRRRPRYRSRANRLWRATLIAGLIVGAVWLVVRGPVGPVDIVVPEPADSVRAVDGDSFDLMNAGASTRLRIDGIDAPELRQTCQRADGRAWPCGAEAAAALAAYVLEHGLSCARHAEDRYARAVATCETRRTPDIGAAMVERGLAIATGRRGYERYLREEARAEAQKRGLWQGEFVRPADWRAEHPRTGNQARP